MKASDLPTLSTFETHLEAMLTATDTGSILPTAQRVNSNVNGWRSTQQSMGVMPKAKTKARKAGDQAYGGGASSGLKVKRVKVDKASTSASTACSSTTSQQSTTTSDSAATVYSSSFQQLQPTPPYLYPTPAYPIALQTTYPPTAYYSYPAYYHSYTPQDSQKP
ncbi:hypothetical protein MVEN_01558300 [Mycena venus]|uniref:Uncharacterized protein n=1 Tax=Mycena venus TaxID=2733690 RepID=A0A8H7CRE3_9AGAR|nr:hypothetical protein MVEN_01558100 [Mycena venus]KAF7345403.1 hypothetical protein MVEN_01558300 [Mycena venus]